MFGYEQKVFLNKQSLIFATPEKAILDLLYLYPQYNNEQEIRENSYGFYSKLAYWL
ncbi:hypothetical protein AGMMS50262_16800 [Bacteroidia bacterium]|nr:hypothetical protein AGMMS50262_16800 [Bacteroidia bacterium]